MTTPRQLIDRAEQRFAASDLFFGHGAATALDEAAYLVLGALDLPFDLDREQLNGEVSALDQQRIGQLVDERIRSRKPTAYLLNKGLVRRAAVLRGRARPGAPFAHCRTGP